MQRPLRHVLTALALIAVDLAVYIIIGLLLMDYDDSYDATKGTYWSMRSMTPHQQAVYIALHVWHGVNLMAMGYVILWVFRKVKSRGPEVPLLSRFQAIFRH